jgi:FkbM family methyltransferase
VDLSKLFQQPSGLWCPSTGQTCYDWTMAEIHLPKLLMDSRRQFNQSVKNVIHAGGNMGIYALEFAKECENVYVFEPADENFSALALNCAMVENIFLYKAALGNDNKPINVVNETADKQCGAWKVKGSGKIPTLKIDDLNLDDVSIIHLDIEGYELYAIQGAENTIKKCKPLLSFEILNHNVDYGYSQQELYDYVINLGYNSSLKVGNEILFVMDTI